MLDFNTWLYIEAFSYECIPKNNFISQPKHMLWVLKRTVSMRWGFLSTQNDAKTDGQENIYNFMLKNFLLLNL